MADDQVCVPALLLLFGQNYPLEDGGEPSECPFTFTHRVTTRLSVTACTIRLHTAIAVAFFMCRACPVARGAVHWSLVYCESYTISTPISSLVRSCSPCGAMFRVLHVSTAAMMCGTADSSAVEFYQTLTKSFLSDLVWIMLATTIQQQMKLCSQTKAKKDEKGQVKKEGSCDPNQAKNTTVPIFLKSELSE